MRMKQSFLTLMSFMSQNQPIQGQCEVWFTVTFYVDSKSKKQQDFMQNVISTFAIVLIT